MTSTHAVTVLPFCIESVIVHSLRQVLRSERSDFSFSEECLEELDHISHAIQYPAGTIVFVEGQTSRGVYVLTCGMAKLTTTSRAGRTFIVKLAYPGTILGLHEAVSGRPCELTAEVVDPSQLSFIHRDDFSRFLLRHGDACLQVAMQLGQECQSAYELVRSIGLSHTVTEKLARLILQWSKHGAPGDGVARVRLVLTHEEIAQLIGSTRETVTRILSEFKKHQILEVSGCALLIHDLAALERLVS
jgi:CRP/FNR family transcriptional regulator, cyclic AMP receptor protein